MSPKKTFVRKKRVTATQMNNFAEPEVAAMATAIPALFETVDDVDAFFTAMVLSGSMEPSELTFTEPGDNEPSAPSSPPTIANKPALSATDWKIVLDAVVRIAGYFLNHPKMAQMGDCVLKMAEWGMVRDAKRVIGLLKGRPADDEVVSGDEAVVEGARTEVFQAVVRSARYLNRCPEMWRADSAVADAMVDMVIKVVGFLDGHPAAGRLAVSKEVSEFVGRKHGELEMERNTWMNG